MRPWPAVAPPATRTMILPSVPHSKELVDTIQAKVFGNLTKFTSHNRVSASRALNVPSLSGLRPCGKCFSLAKSFFYHSGSIPHQSALLQVPLLCYCISSLCPSLAACLWSTHAQTSNWTLFPLTSQRVLCDLALFS